MNKLPQELIDLVIAHLRDDAQALKCCSTVCWAWSPAARSHLFEVIYIVTTKSLVPILNPSSPFSGTRRIFASGLEKTQNILQLPWPSQFNHVIELHLNYIYATTVQLEQLVQPFFANFPNLEILTVHNSHFLSFNTIIRAIHSFDHLRRVKISYTKWDIKYDPQTVDFPHSSLSVRHLCLVYPYDTDVVDCLLDLHPILPLLSLHLGTQGEAEDGSLERRLRKGCCASLRVLDLRRQPPQTFETLDLKIYPSLTTIIMPPFFEVLIPRILTTTTSRNIREIFCISRATAADTHTREHLWALLQQLMQSTLFRDTALYVCPTKGSQFQMDELVLHMKLLFPELKSPANLRVIKAAMIDEEVRSKLTN